MDPVRISSPADCQADTLPGGTYTRATGVFLSAVRLCITATLFLWGCSSRDLHKASRSELALGYALVRALNSGDAAALESLMLTEQEYKKILYPALPLSKPEWNTPADTAWSMQIMSRTKNQQRIMAEWSGRNLELVQFSYVGTAEKYADFEILRKARLTVREADGHEQTLEFVGSALKKNGQIKLIGWRDT